MQAHPEGSSQPLEKGILGEEQGTPIPKKTQGKPGKKRDLRHTRGQGRDIAAAAPGITRKTRRTRKKGKQGSLAFLRRVPLMPGAGAQGKACPGFPRLGKGGRCHPVTFSLLRRFPGNGNVQPGILTGSCSFPFLFYGRMWPFLDFCWKSLGGTP